jgi:DNA-binding transcriptional ArsR family regulator
MSGEKAQMSAHTDFVQELATDIAAAAGQGQWESVKADLSVLSDQLVQALIQHRESDVAAAYDAVERAYSTLATRHKLDDQISDVESAAIELRAYTRLLGAALQHKAVPDRKDTALADTNRPLLEVLRRTPHGLSGRELAETLKVQPETIARKLPVLRAAGLVQSQQVGRSTINKVTAEARKLLDREHAKSAAAAAAAGNIIARKVSAGDSLTGYSVPYSGLPVRPHPGFFGQSPEPRANRVHASSVPDWTSDVDVGMNIDIVTLPWPVQEVQVVGGTSDTQSSNLAELAELIVEPGLVDRLARLNVAVAGNRDTDELTIHFYPYHGLVVANLESKNLGEDDWFNTSGLNVF